MLLFGTSSRRFAPVPLLLYASSRRFFWTLLLLGPSSSGRFSSIGMILLDASLDASLDTSPGSGHFFWTLQACSFFVPLPRNRVVKHEEPVELVHCTVTLN